MKIRLGFVSNSSSASYVIDKDGLSDEIIQKIIDHWDLASKIIGDLLQKEYPWCLKGHEYYGDDSWDVHNEATRLELYTIITNFPMLAYLKAIGVPSRNIEILDNEGDNNPYDDLEEHHNVPTKESSEWLEKFLKKLEQKENT